MAVRFGTRLGTWWGTRSVMRTVMRTVLQPLTLPALCIALCLALALGLPRVAHAESLRCQGEIVSEGDTRLTVLRRCGQPALKDARCAPVFVAGRVQPLPDHLAALVAPCVTFEDWLYEREAGFLPATVRFRGGVVQAIFYGKESQ